MTVPRTESVRMDKWLWAARFFKTRALAAKACEMGRIAANGLQAKASRDVHPSDRLRIRNEAGDFHVEVLGLSAVRGPAAVAAALYRETEESRLLRMKAIEARKLEPQFDAFRGDGRPSKRNRRQMDRLRGGS